MLGPLRKIFSMRPSLKNLLKSLWGQITSHRRRQFAFMIALTVFSSLAEVVSLGAVLPFIGILTHPEKVFSSPWLEGLVRAFGITSAAELVIPLAIGFALAALIAGGMRLLLLWYGIRLANGTGAELSMEVYQRTLYQPYSVHIARSSSEIISGITQKIDVATSAMISVVTFITSSLLFLAILFALLFFDPEVSIIATIIFGSAYGLIAHLTRKRLARNSHNIAQGQTQTIKALQEGLGAIRDVLLDGAQKIYCGVYNEAVIKLQRANSENVFINQAPRYAMESLGMALIAVLVFALSFRPGGIEGALPILAMLALGAQRLLPLMQQIYGNWSVMAGSEAALAEVLALLKQPLPVQSSLTISEPLFLKRFIRFERVSFKYGETMPWILEDINLVIPKGAHVGIIGTTGSGKSTVLDLLMGLLEPTQGRILVDEQPIGINNHGVWQKAIAHVPQSIFLADATIAENIAFGVPADLIDLERVRKVSKQAHISEFIEKRPGAYNAIVGERGIFLSGGQRQRIGIARSLYKQASVLVFDEATSALDNETEQAVMQAIDSLSEDLTLFIIAHRLTTLKNCSLIIEMDKGQIKQVGTYHQVVGSLL